MKTKMNLALALTIIFTLVFSSTSAMASVPSIETQSYKYNYKGLPINSDTPLTNDQLEYIYNDIFNPSEQSEIAPLSIDGGGNGGIVTSPKYYRTYSNKGIRLTITALSHFVGTALKISGTPLSLLVLGTFNATDAITPTYIGTWNWEGWDRSGYTPIRKKYSTVVTYKHSNYTVPTNVEVVETGYAN